MNRDELGRLFADAIRTVDCESMVTDDDWNDEDSVRSRENFCQAGEWFAAHLSPSGRAFHARVSLMGHRDLGLCRVTEASLAGVVMLRIEVDGAVEWVNPAALYSAREVPEAEALAEIAKAAAEEERSNRMAAESKARRNAERSQATADVVIDRAHDLTALRASLPNLLRRYDHDLTAALNAEGIESWSEFSNADGRPVGIVVEGDHSDALSRVSAALGFTSGSIRPPLTDDELDADIPF